MKKVTALFICLALYTSVYSQVKFIPKVGTSWATVTFDANINDQFVGDFDYGYKSGFIIGLAAEIPVAGDRFSLQPEVLFHQKGYSSKYDESEVSDPYSASYKTTLNYLEVPVLARVNFGNFHVATGPYVGFGIGGKWKGTDTYLGHTQENEGNVNFGKEPDNYAGSDAYFNAVDFGLQMGIGVKISVVVIDLRYGLGLSDIQDKRDLNTKTCNRSLQLTVGFPIVGRKKFSLTSI